MKSWFITLVLVSSSVLYTGCGKTAGRTSGQSSEIKTAPLPTKQVVQLENSIGKIISPSIPGFRILGVVPTASLPRTLRILDQGSPIGTLAFDFEIKKYQPAYVGTIGDPEISSESVPTAYKAYLMANPADSAQTLLTIASGQPEETFLRSSEPVTIQYKSVSKCSQVYVPRRDRDSIPDQNSRCDHKTEVCYVKHVFNVLGRAYEVEEPKLIWHIVHDYPGSACVARKPDFTEVGERQNTRQATQVRVELFRSLVSEEGAQLQFNL